MSDIPEEKQGLPPLLVFADDWGRHPSSCQHLIRQFLPRYSVHWINTIGMRTPRLDGATLRRGLEKLRHWFRPTPTTEPTVLPPNLNVHNPRMWPWFTRAHDRRLNQTLLRKALHPLIEGLPEPPVVITALPIVADLMGALRVRRWVYYCVDDFSQWPGLDQTTLAALERTVISRADVLIAVSETLQERIGQLGRKAHLLTHGIDPDHWTRPTGAATAASGLPRPLIIYWGVIDRRMDISWMRRLAEDLQEGTILLVGPEDDPDPGLRDLPRLVRRPAISYEDLPALAQAGAVLIMPYADLPVTRAMQPLKLKEYLATGKPVVGRRLPAMTPWSEALDLVDTAEQFSEAVRRRLREGLPESQLQAREALREESWGAKARLFETWALTNGD